MNTKTILSLTNMQSPIEHRIKRFAELHNNKWFHVMNFNLDFMRTTDKKCRKIHALSALGFYMAVAPVEQKLGLRPSAFGNPLFEKLKQ